MLTGYISIAETISPSLFALTKEEQEAGLMYIEYPPPTMTFVYAFPQINKFWMRNTPSPLDIIFSNNGKITQIHKGEPYSLHSIGNDTFSDLVIELPYGTAKKFYFNVGDEVSIIKPNKEELAEIINKHKNFRR